MRVSAESTLPFMGVRLRAARVGFMSGQTCAADEVQRFALHVQVGVAKPAQA
jgi:hypothetical protein